MSEHTVVKYKSGKFGVIKASQVVEKIDERAWIVKTSKGSKGSSYAAQPIQTFSSVRDALALAKELATEQPSAGPVRLFDSSVLLRS